MTASITREAALRLGMAARELGGVSLNGFVHAVGDRIGLPLTETRLAAITVTAITLVSYTAMAGVVGAGGLGDLAIRYGYQRFDTQVMLIVIAVLIALVSLVQFTGDRWVRWLRFR